MPIELSDDRRNALIENLANGHGVKESCDLSNISHATYYKWIATDSKFKTAIEKAKDSRIQIAEDSLLEQVKKGNPTSTIFFLCNRAPDRWRNILKNENEKAINFNIFTGLINAIKDLSVEQLKEYATKLPDNSTDMPPDTNETKQQLQITDGTENNQQSQ